MINRVFRLIHHGKRDAALREAGAAMSWLPIETAPRDGSEIDLWIVMRLSQSDHTEGYGVPRCKWINGHWCRKIEDGDYAGEDEKVEFTIEDIRPEKRAKWEGYFHTVTHWMSIPPGPHQ